MTHLDNHQLTELLRGSTGTDEKVRLMQHICECDECAEKLADLTLGMATVQPPEGLGEEVFAAAARERSAGQKKKESFMLYTVRVVAGICAAIVMLFSGVFDRITQIDINMSKVSDAGQTISEAFDKGTNYIADKLFDREDKDNEKK